MKKLKVTIARPVLGTPMPQAGVEMEARDIHIAVPDGVGDSIDPAGLTFDTELRDHVLNLFGVPPDVVGQSDASLYAGMRAAETQWLMDRTRWLAMRLRTHPPQDTGERHD